MFLGPRRRTRRPPPIAAAGGDASPLELSLLVLPGAEAGALKELRALGVGGAEQIGRGELRVVEPGPLRPLLAAERPTAVYAVRRLGATELAGLDPGAALRAALELAGVVASLNRGRLGSYRLAVARELGRPPAKVNRLRQQLASRLGLDRSADRPDLVLVLRPGADGLELAARLPRPGEERATGGAPPTRTSRPPRTPRWS
ncbi:MAG TPA: hypothetical protein VG370_17665 [Chloroflexota bacterium]|jgi:hypothetical protein|nr:hypothetical protein [Chloroflexota bacterium]